MEMTFLMIWLNLEGCVMCDVGPVIIRPAGEVKRYPCGLMVTRRSQDLHDKVQRWCVVMWDETPQTPQTEQGALITSGVSGVCGVSSSQCMMRKKENNDHVRAHVIGCGNSPHTPHTPQTVNTILIRILQHVGTITGSDGREYELQAGDTVTLPEDNARSLIDKHAAVELRTWEKPIHIRDPEFEQICYKYNYNPSSLAGTLVKYKFMEIVGFRRNPNTKSKNSKFRVYRILPQQ